MSERPDEGTLLAFIDNELDERGRDEVEHWIHTDPSVARELDELAEAAGRLGVALTTLDRDQAPISTELPLALRSRAGAAGGSTSARGASRRPPRRRFLQVTWGRAAVLILAAGLAGASALPGSPVSGWWRAGWAALQGEDAAGTTALTSEQAETPAGVAMTPEFGRLTVRVEGVQPGTRLTVHFGPTAEPGVFATGEPSFATGTGFVDVRDPGSQVEVRVPASVTELEVWVDGVQYLTRNGAELRTPVEPTERAADAVVYLIQTRTGNP